MGLVASRHQANGEAGVITLPPRGKRYDKLAANYLAFVELASICLWLRVN